MAAKDFKVVLSIDGVNQPAERLRFANFEGNADAARAWWENHQRRQGRANTHKMVSIEEMGEVPVEQQASFDSITANPGPLPK